MSISAGKFTLYLARAAWLLLLLCGAATAQQTIEATIKIDGDFSPTVFVEGETVRKSGGESNGGFSFAHSSTNEENVGDRISDLIVRDRERRELSVRKLAAGEYLAGSSTAFWSYKIDLKSPQNANVAARVSSIKETRGILMLADLLPQFSGGDGEPISAIVKFDLPKDWTITTRERKTRTNVFAVEDVEKAIFLVGKGWRVRQFSVGASRLDLAISGDWLFSDEEAENIVCEIYGEYERMFGEAASDTIQITLSRFPVDVKSGRWSAETRGANLTIFSADMPFKAQSLQRFHEQMRHELFHLWIPNRLALAGNYDWFYEGFAVYQALKTGVALNRIRFEDFLDTLAQAFDREQMRAPKISLIEAAKTRRSGANDGVYARGMLVAFLSDVALLRQSKGRRATSDLVKEIYRAHRSPNQKRDGNAAILDVLKKYKELNSVVENYIEGARSVDWQADLDAIGVEQSPENDFTRLKIKAKLNGRQKDLLNELGYNNWRKISEK